ncbi:MAG: glycosyltransferase family 39 protein [Sandaracinaceae bacterium]
MSDEKRNDDEDLDAEEEAVEEGTGPELEAGSEADSAPEDSEDDDSEGDEGEPSEDDEAKADASRDAEPDAEPDAAESDAAVSKDTESNDTESKGAESKAAPPVKATAAPASRTHLIRGGVLTFVGFFASFLMMANESQVSHGPLWGMLTMLLGTAGLLDLLGLWHDGAAGRTELRETALFAREGEAPWTSPLIAAPVALAVLAIGAAVGGYDGLPITIVAALACLLPAALTRPGLMVLLVAGGLYLPFLGVYGLWDPWETHYGEVAREILARDDWISLWWAQEDWFWSKPILIFWSEALSMGALGVDFHADANPAHPEWAIRLPHFILATGALYAIYALVSQRFSKRAGLVTATVVATLPHFFFLAHQAITDMPFVSNMTMAIAMLGLAVTAAPDREVKRFGIGPVTFSLRHLVIGLITVVVVPQILYLLSRNVTWMDTGAPFGWHGDMFMSGSAGNNGIPGNSPVHDVEPAFAAVGAQPVVQALIWLLGYLGLLWLLRKETRSQSLYMFAFYFFCGLAFMAKGIPGFALPGLVALFFLIGTRRWDLLLEGKLRVGAGILTVLTVGMPWYVAMYIRHGQPFTDRLLIHDHINRLTAGVHGDTGSIEYFIEQMGYGLFPWIALAPLALAAWLAPWRRQTAPDDEARRQVLILVALWLASAFTLFSAMTTKFHHYIFPAVPPAGILVGLAVDRLLSRAPKKTDWRRIGATALALVAPLPAIAGVGGMWGDLHGVVPEGVDEAAVEGWVSAQAWSTGQSVFAILIAGLLLAGAWRLMQRTSPKTADPRDVWAKGAVTTGLLVAPPVLALVGRDLSWVTDARPQGYERLIHLFVYNYGRPWPEYLDFRPALTGFAVVAVCVVLIAAIKPLRDVATRAFLGVALLFAVWALDVYMIELSPHWGQREQVQRYYELRTGPEEPLVAWQMNWKGENFYTGNRVSVFVQLDNQALRTWVGQNQGTTAYFLLEHSRLANLRSVLSTSTIEEVTDERFDNKFILIRVHVGQRDQTPRDQRE